MIEGRRIVAILPLGGAGTRLWPLSNDRQPKQFLRLFEQRSLFQRTYLRLSAIAVDEVVVVTNGAYEQAVLDEVAELGAPAPQLVLEPMRRDSGPAIAVGVAAAVAQFGAQTILAVLPGDHLIPDQDHFARSFADAVALAARDWLVTLGIRPTFASTEYGYIQQGEPIADHAHAFHVAKFHEKPDQATAEKYLRDTSYHWNSGVFLFTADAFAHEAMRHMPDIWSAAQRAVGAAPGSTRVCVDRAVFQAMRKVSMDVALFEKSDRVGVIPVDFAWSDIGNWASVYEAFDKDACDNVVLGQVQIRDSSGSLAIAEGAPLIVVGARDLVVVASPQGTFVAPRARAPSIKGILAADPPMPNAGLDADENR